MATPNIDEKARHGAEDAGRYFRYMADFVGFAEEDAAIIRRSKPYLEKHLPEIVSQFYNHLLRYPPTRRFFLKSDGGLALDYLQLRMRYLTNFLLRTADGVFDDEYARYVDYVGRAHTSHGGDARVYIPERYLIGQVGFIQHAISQSLQKALHPVDEDLGHAAEDSWAKLMMVLLEMMARAYGSEREPETFDALVEVDQSLVEGLASQAFELDRAPARPAERKQVYVGKLSDIPEGERRIIEVDGTSIGVFHHRGNWYALRNNCLHRGAPVATGPLRGNILICPWHGYQYDITNGKLLTDPSARLEMYTVRVEGDEVSLLWPATAPAPPVGAEAPVVEAPAPAKSVEFKSTQLQPGEIKYVEIDGQGIAVYNVGGQLYATQSACTHAGGPLDQGILKGQVVTCPIHRARFDVTNGQVVGPPARRPLNTYKVTVSGAIARVEKP